MILQSSGLASGMSLALLQAVVSLWLCERLSQVGAQEVAVGCGPGSV